MGFRAVGEDEPDGLPGIFSTIGGVPVSALKSSHWLEIMGSEITQGQRQKTFKLGLFSQNAGNRLCMNIRQVGSRKITEKDGNAHCIPISNWPTLLA